MKIVNVDGFEVGGKKTFIIADIGSNHKQDLVLAKESIDAAKEAGANAVKFQSIQLSELYFNPDNNTSDFIKKLEFPEEWHSILKKYCDERNVTFFSSPTYLKSVDLLENVNVPLYKLASAQVGTFPQIIDKVASLQKPTIFSTGISSYEDVIKAVKIFRKHSNDQFIILHCNSIYPTPASRVNLSLMNTYKNMFGNPVGFSDHTNGIHISCSAVAIGAKVIEKHFTIDRNLNTPDCSSFASDPAEFTKLVNEIRDIESAIATNDDRIAIQEEENNFKNSVSYKIFAASDIPSGSKILEEQLMYFRTSEGIDCKEYASIIGKIAIQNIDYGKIITYGSIK